MTRGRARRYLLVKQGYYPQVVADAGYTVFDWSTLNAGTLFQDSAKTTPVTANSDPVGAWVDGVGGVDAVQATTANKPTYTTGSLNGLPTLAFNVDMLATANIAISTFAVWMIADVNNTNSFLFEQSVSSGANPGMSLYNDPSNVAFIRVNRSATVNAKTNQATTPADFAIFRYLHNGTNATHQLYIDGVLQTMTENTPNDVGTGTATTALYIGARAGVALGMTGNVAHLCIVSPYPTDASIIVNMESYINNQWRGVY